MQAEKIQRARNTLLYKDYPVKTTRLYDIVCIFKVTCDPVPFDLTGQLEFANKYIELFDSLSNPLILRDIPAVLFFEIIYHYGRFRTSSLDEIFLLLFDYSKTAESRELWQIISAVGIDTVFQKPGWDAIRHYWSILNVNEDYVDKWDMIKTVFEAVQPWMNHELWSKVQAKDKARRSNVTYDVDPELADRMEKAAMVAWKKRQNKKRPKSPNPDDMDEITIEK